jgi:hypothetical protein
MKLSTTQKTIILGLIVALAITIPTVLGVSYYLNMSAPAQTQVNDTTQGITPTFSVTPTITIGESVTLTANCGVNWAGKSINFYEVGTATPLGSATTNGAGTATFVTIPTSIGIHSYTAGP